jgi:16S rRNA C967 or C1407 C5-methylase (RsmB/RsmF family)/NOL1/NOP2/fmu family ribosome biogenesis protein
MFPAEFIQRIKSQQYIDPENLLAALAELSQASIRINPGKWDRIPENSVPVQWCQNGYYLEKRPSFTLDPLFHGGCYYPQEASGMFIEQVYRQVTGNRKNIKVLDLCGAPGGKSTHLSSLIWRDGFIVSNDVIKSRALILAENLSKWGLSNAIVTQSDPSSFSMLQGFFDIFLIDAPCSGEGMFRDQVAINEWSVENASLCSQRQKRILADAWPALKDEGILIYSTCTFNPAENERNILWLTQNRKAETIRLDISEFDDIKEIDYNGIYGYGFYPGKIKGEGLFISVLKKKEAGNNVHPVKIQQRERKADKNEIKIASELSHFPEESIISSGNDLYSIPCDYKDYNLLSKFLNILKPGTGICTLKRNNQIPSHELALSILIRKSVFYTLNLDYDEAIRYLKRENIQPSGAVKGWNLVSYKDVNLGFLNNIGTRMNNYYPVEWRIRMKTEDNDSRNVIKWD